MAVEPRETFARKRRWAIGLNVLAASALAPAAGFLLLYLAFHPSFRQRLDFTQKQDYTLSERTHRVLAELGPHPRQRPIGRCRVAPRLTGEEIELLRGGGDSPAHQQDLHDALR